MPVYTAEPSAEERTAAAALVESAARGASVESVPAPRSAAPAERIPA